MIRKLLIIRMLLFTAALFPLIAQNTNGNLAKNKYLSGMGFYKDSKYEEALKDFEVIIEKYPTSEWAALSMMQKGIYFMDIAGKPADAKVQFEKLVQNFPKHKNVPFALLKVGDIQLLSSDEINKLNDPISTFERIIRTYPSTEYSAEAAFKAAGIFFRLGNMQKAMEKIKIVNERFTKSAFYPDAMLLKAIILATDSEYVEAAKLLQVLSDSKQNKTQGKQAKKLLAALQRIKLEENYKYKIDSSFKLDANQPLKNPRNLYIDISGQLYVFDTESKTVNVYNDKGAVVNTVTASLEAVEYLLGKDGKSIFVDAEGGIDSEGATSNLTFIDGEESRPVLKPRLLRDNSFNNLFVVSRKGDHIFRFDSSFAFRMRVSGYEFENIKCLEIDNFGKLYVIDSSYNGILIFNQTGSEAGKISGESTSYNFKEPLTIKFDKFNHMFLYDQGLESFLVFDNNRRFIKQISLPSQIEEVLDFTVSDSGEIYILDEDLKTILKIF